MMEEGFPVGVIDKISILGNYPYLRFLLRKIMSLNDFDRGGVTESMNHKLRPREDLFIPNYYVCSTDFQASKSHLSTLRAYLYSSSTVVQHLQLELTSFRHPEFNTYT